MNHTFDGLESAKAIRLHRYKQLTNVLACVQCTVCRLFTNKEIILFCVSRTIFLFAVQMEIDSVSFGVLVLCLCSEFWDCDNFKKQNINIRV